MNRQLNNYTTPEQSKELLEIGLPEYTADCYYSCSWAGFKYFTYIGPYIKGSTNMAIITERDMPCWSIGRLMEIYLKCHEGFVWCGFEFNASEADNMIDKLIERFKKSESKFNYSVYDN